MDGGLGVTVCSDQTQGALETHLAERQHWRIRFADHVVGKGEALFQRVEALNLEGMVMKRRDSVYSGFQSRDWLKVSTTAGKTTIQKRIETWG